MSNEWVPRLQQDEMTPALRDYLEPRVKRLGYLGEWFRCAGNAPEPMIAFLHFTDALKEALPANISETIVLTVAAFLENDYERNQHERLAIRTGFSREWIAEVTGCEPDLAATMSLSERAAQRWALAALSCTRQETHVHFAGLKDHFTPSEAMSIVLLVGRYWTHALGVAALQLEAPVPSIFEDDFSA